MVDDVISTTWESDLPHPTGHSILPTFVGGLITLELPEPSHHPQQLTGTSDFPTRTRNYPKPNDLPEIAHPLRTSFQRQPGESRTHAITFPTNLYI